MRAKIYSAATNFAVDLMGEPDSRPNTWGTAGVHEWRITFCPPRRRRVRILRIYGDFVAWPLGRVERGSFAGLLFGLKTTAPDGSRRVQPAADNTMLYIQCATGGEPVRAPFDCDVSAGGLLGRDNTLVVKVAVWLNTTGVAIHMEPTFVMIYQFI